MRISTNFNLQMMREDVITCSLVLCSVSDQERVLREIKRLLNASGCYGFVEHVAVDLENENEKSKSFLEFQQRAFDPLQQAVAHNCHLHRQTDQVISGVFEASAEFLERERFFVESMWPVSCQCSGILKMNG
jgi:ubiquinone/menaquinone biosynthesis C-methylase UbiE